MTREQMIDEAVRRAFGWKDGDVGRLATVRMMNFEWDVRNSAYHGGTHRASTNLMHSTILHQWRNLVRGARIKRMGA